MLSLNATYRIVAGTAGLLTARVVLPSFMAFKLVTAAAESRNGENGADNLLDTAGTAIASSVLVNHDTGAVRVSRRLS